MDASDRPDQEPTLDADLTLLLERTVGVELLAFLLATDGSDVQQQSIVATDARGRVVEELLKIVDHHAPKRDAEDAWAYQLPYKPLDTNQLLDLFATYDEALQTTRGSAFFVQSGGIRPTHEPLNTLEGVLQQIAVDCYPARLIGDARQSLVGVSIRRHPRFQAACDLVMDSSEPIAEIHRAAVQNSPLSDYEREREQSWPFRSQIEVHWSPGSGGSLNLREVPASLVASVAIDADGDDQVLVRITEGTSDALRRARGLASGALTLTRTVVGLGNVSLTADASPISFPGGVLRRPTMLDRRLSPFTDSPTAVLEFEVETRYVQAHVSTMPPPNQTRQDRLAEFASEMDRLKQFSDEMTSVHKEIEEVIALARFAIVLASGEEVAAPTWLFTRGINPLTTGGFNSHNPTPSSSTLTPPGVIDTAAATEVATWATAMATMPDALKISRRRLLQATTERHDEIDAFIDAVVCWENLFGGKQDSTFRVAGSMAVILEASDTTARAVIHQRLAMLYDLRSSLVHGSVGHDVETKKFKIADAPTYANEAVTLAIKAFRHVLATPELIPLDSSSRSKRILLGI